jgi:ATP-binding cassette subfamily B protein
MIAKYYGRSVSLEKLQKLSETTREGSSLLNISAAAEKPVLSLSNGRF